MTRKDEIYNQLVELFGAVDKQPKNIDGVMSDEAPEYYRYWED